MMKPKAENDHSTGMLEYLEDVIGTVRYKVSFYLLQNLLIFLPPTGIKIIYLLLLYINNCVQYNQVLHT